MQAKAGSSQARLEASRSPQISWYPTPSKATKGAKAMPQRGGEAKLIQAGSHSETNLPWLPTSAA